jgi:hypothetical protein
MSNMKRIAAVILFLLFNNSFAQETQVFEFNKIYSYVLQGDVAKVLEVLNTLPDEQLSPEEKKIKKKFFERFRLQEEVVDYNTSDPMLHDLLDIYQTYWRQALLDNENMEHYESGLKRDIASFLKKNKYPTQNEYVEDTLTDHEIQNNFTQHLKNFLAEKNYYSATGQTAGFFDLFIWEREVPTEFKVVLPETEVTTTIIFLKDVVTMGWEEYASFGKVYPGGWATKEVLYAVGKAYDTTSENFKVSYLKHESQHFADYKTYPNLSGVDLEYRAKLTELIYAEETLYNLISSFIRNASSEGRNPHAFGGYAVIRDLSQKIFAEEFVTEIEQWKCITPERIKQESEDLLKAHSAALEEAGADSVIELIQ